MKQCKPCITIRDIVKILYNNIVLFYKNTRKDIRSYSRVNATVCELDKPVGTKIHPANKIIHAIREQAKSNYLPTELETKEAWVRGAEEYLRNTKDTGEVVDKVREMLEKYYKDLEAHGMLEKEAHSV